MARKNRDDSIMTIEQYAEDVSDFATYPDAGERSAVELNYTVLALCGEAGELANELKKAFHKDRFGYQQRCLTPERREKMIQELGDVEWYAKRVAFALAVDATEVARLNIAKLDERHADPASPDFNAEIAERRRIRRARK